MVLVEKKSVIRRKIHSNMVFEPTILSSLSAIVSFGEVSSTQKEEAENQCVSLFSWHEFLLMVSLFLFISRFSFLWVFD